MRTNPLGTSGLEVSVLTLGCWAFAGDQNWGAQEESDSIATIHAALDHGFTCLDTAPAYGNGRSTEVVGKALKGRRDQVVIADKISCAIDSIATMKQSVETSLSQLQTDYIDLMQLHWPQRDFPTETIVEGMEELKASGKIRAFGVCNYGVNDMKEWQAEGPLASNQLPYSLLSRAIEFDIVPYCVEHGVGILAYSTLLQGLLSGKFYSADEVPVGRARTRHFSSSREQTRHTDPGCEKETFEAIAQIRDIAGSLEKPMEAVSLAWVAQQPGISTVIVGARNPDQIKNNAAAGDLQLDASTLASLGGATDEVKEILGANPDLWQSETRYR